MLEAGRPQENRRDFELSRFSGMPSFGAECTGPLNFPHTYQISAYNLARFNDLRICTLVFLVVEFSECGKSSQLNHLRVIKPQSAFQRIVQVTGCSGHSLNYESKLTL